MKEKNKELYFLSLILILILPILFSCYAYGATEDEQDFFIHRKIPIEKLNKLLVGEKLECDYDNDCIFIKIPAKFTNKSIDIKLTIYFKRGNPQTYYLTVYNAKDGKFKYRIAKNDFEKAEAYILKNKIGTSIIEVEDFFDFVFVSVYQEPKMKSYPAKLVVRGYDQDNEQCYVSSMNISSLTEGEENLLIKTQKPPVLKHIEVYLEYVTIKSTRIIDWSYYREGKKVYITATYAPKLSKGFNDTHLYLKLSGYDKNGNIVVLSSRNMFFDKRYLIREDGYLIETCIVDLHLPNGVEVDKWDVSFYPKEELETFPNKSDNVLILDYLVDKKGNLYIVYFCKDSNITRGHLIIKGFDDKKNKVFLTSRNILLRRNFIDTCIVPNIPLYLKYVNIEYVPQRPVSSFIIDYYLDKANKLYVVGVNNCEEDDNLWIKIEGIDEKGRKVWIGSRNFRVIEKSIDTCIVDNIPSYVKKVNVSILPKMNGFVIHDSFFDNERNKLFLIMSSYDKDRKVKIQISGYNTNNKLIYETVYSADLKNKIISAHTINISSKKKLAKVSIKTLK